MGLEAYKIADNGFKVFLTLPVLWLLVKECVVNLNKVIVMHNQQHIKNIEAATTFNWKYNCFTIRL